MFDWMARRQSSCVWAAASYANSKLPITDGLQTIHVTNYIDHSYLQLALMQDALGSVSRHQRPTLVTAHISLGREIQLPLKPIFATANIVLVAIDVADIDKMSWNKEPLTRLYHDP